MIFIGIDPGLSGGIAILNDNTPLCICKMPTWKNGTKNEIDLQTLRGIFTEHIPPVEADSAPKCVVCIENVHAMPGQGVTSMFNFGMAFGIALGVIACYDPVLFRVAPQRWKKAILQGYANKTKDVSREEAVRRYPQLSTQLRPKNADGMAEALLMAEYVKSLYHT